MQTKKTRHIPMRMCLVTREKLPKNELIRIVKLSETGELKVDLKGKLRGRGANLKPSLEVFDQMVKREVLKHALDLAKAPTPEVYSELREEFEKAIEEKKFRPNNKPVSLRVKLDELK